MVAGPKDGSDSKQVPNTQAATGTHTDCEDPGSRCPVYPLVLPSGVRIWWEVIANLPFLAMGFVPAACFLPPHSFCCCC